MVPPPKKFDDEDESSEEESGKPITALAPKKKWDDEEESDDDVLDSWDAADDSEEEAKKAAKAAAKAAAPPEPKKSKDQRIAEKKAAAALAAAESAARDGPANETPAERRARMQAMELQSDLHHAEDLFGSGSGPSRKPPTITSVVVDPKDPSSRTVDLASLAIFNPDSKLAFDRLRDVLVPLISKNSKAPGYNVFCQEFARAISQGLNGSEQIRLVASKLTTLANERLKEEKAAEKGKKGKKAEKKASLAASGKEMDRLDTKNYEDEYHDFDDFM